jgi:O-succinylbenzoic acid--CoA ligase
VGDGLVSAGIFADVVDVDAPALVTAQGQLRWRDLIARVSSSSSSSPSSATRLPLVGDTGEAAVLAVFAALHHGATPALAHPRWPTAMREAAFARAGVGRPLSGTQRALLGDDVATIVFSSGSSGAPKAVLHGWGAHRAGAAGAAERMPFGPGDRWLLSLPICHVGGLALIARALHRGGAIALPTPGQSLVDAVVALTPTHVSVVAAQLRALLSSPAACAVLARAHTILVGGGPTPRSLFDAALAAGLPVRQTWGLTEMGSQVCTSPAGQPSTCGAPLPGRRLRVAADGELIVGGAGRFSGFVDGDDVTQPFDDDGGYATGDLGAFVDDGIGGEGLIILGRKDFRFISGGENIQPEAVAAALADADVAVFVVPVDDAIFGQRPFAFFDGAPAGCDDDDIVTRLRARAEAALPRFMHPVGYARLPTLSGIKPRRADLVAAAQARWNASSSPASTTT